MGKVFLDMVLSLDGFIAGPHDEDRGLHTWYFAPSGGATVVIDELVHTIGAMVLGRRTYDIGVQQGGFADSPYRVPHFVLAHQAPPGPTQGEPSMIFVRDGIESALAHAKAAVGDKAVCIAGGANVAQQYLKAGLLDDIQIHLVSVLLGDGIRLFDQLSAERIELERTRVIESPGVTHLSFRVVKQGKETV